MKKRRSVIILSILCIALFLTACGGSKTEGEKDGNNAQGDKNETEKQLEKIAVGDTVTVNTKQGDVTFKISGLVKSDWKERIGEEGDFFVGILLTEVENVSFKDEYNPGMVSMDMVMTVYDMENMQKEFYSTGYDYEDYLIATGGSVELAEGSKAKVATPYKLASDTQKIHININNQYELDVDLQ